MLRVIDNLESYMVCIKPAGLPVQTKKVTQQDCVSILRNSLGTFYVGVVHRLDQPVEGLLVFAKTPEAAAMLSAARMEKYYLARVEDTSTLPKSGTLTDWLIKDGRTNRSAVVKKDTPGAKKAVLDYRVLEPGLLEIHLVTGRHHQIRVQLSHAGHPIVGDTKYGGISDETLHLCSYKLELFGKTYEIEPSWR